MSTSQPTNKLILSSLSKMSEGQTFTETTSLKEFLTAFQGLCRNDVLLDTTIRVSHYITHKMNSTHYSDQRWPKPTRSQRAFCRAFYRPPAKA